MAIARALLEIFMAGANGEAAADAADGVDVESAGFVLEVILPEPGGAGEADDANTVRAERAVVIEDEATGAVRVGHEAGLGERALDRALGDGVDDATCGALAIEEGLGAPENLNALGGEHVGLGEGQEAVA